MKVLISFVPVLHAGYLNFFKDFTGDKLYLIGDDLLSEIEYFGREIRALKPIEIKTALEVFRIFESIEFLTIKNIVSFNYPGFKFIMPDEDVARHVAEKYLPRAEVEFRNIFLRWNKRNVESERFINFDRAVSIQEFDMETMHAAYVLSQNSPDWWRQVGAIAVKDGKLLVTAYNRHMPYNYSSYASGDPRTPFKWGERIELTIAAHAEASLVAHAAKEGIILDGASLYVTTFPCPSCAYSIVLAGIKKVYYAEGYSLISAKDVFEAYGINVILVDI